MASMCVMSTSLYNSKMCDGCGKCEHRYDDWDRDYDEDESWEKYCCDESEE